MTNLAVELNTESAYDCFYEFLDELIAGLKTILHWIR